MGRLIKAFIPRNFVEVIGAIIIVSNLIFLVMIFSNEPLGSCI